MNPPDPRKGERKIVAERIRVIAVAVAVRVRTVGPFKINASAHHGFERDDAPAGGCAAAVFLEFALSGLKAISASSR